MTKHTKPFESFINEAKSLASEHSELYDKVSPILTKTIGLLASNADPVKIQAELNKALKEVTDSIRTASRAEQGTSKGLDWDVAPKAPIFVMNLAQRYPQNEKKYYDLWYKAANRNPQFSYGGAIMIFKAYCKRENLLLEEFEFEADEKLAENIFEGTVNESTAYTCATCGERAEHEEIQDNPALVCPNCGDSNWEPEH